MHGTIQTWTAAYIEQFEALQMQRDRATHHKEEISHLTVCNSGMTFKDTQGHYIVVIK